MHRRSLIKSLGLLTGGLAFSNDLSAKNLLPKKTIRLAHITDIHIQPHIGAARGFERCLHRIQSFDKKVDFIINGGDAIMGSHGASETNLARQWELYDKVLIEENSLPIYNCLGNHDLNRKKQDEVGFYDSKREALDRLALPKSYYSFQKSNWKIIVLDSIHPKFEGKGYQGKIDEEQKQWLKSELNNSDNFSYVLIISHIPILSACVFFDGKNFKDGEWRVPESWMHSDSAELVDLFYKYPAVKLAISGHIHLHDKIQYNQMTYCCNGAVSGNWWMGDYKQTSPGFAVIDLHDDGTFENNYMSY
jgi:3',5'-cyclic-AMP phosphodiesterase